MLSCCVASFALLMLVASCSPSDGGTAEGALEWSRVQDNERVEWTRHTVPLPKSIEITDKVVVPADRVAVVFSGEQSMLIESAMAELEECFGTEAGAAAADPAFTIVLALGGSEAESLRDLQNSEQAYRISTTGSEMRITALAPHGLYYGAKTLQQLVAAKKNGATLTIPMLKVTDWPDVQKRGLWGTDNFNHIRWLSDRKMNICEQISVLSVDGNGKPHAGLQEGRETFLTEGPLRGIEFSPVILHLEQASQSGVFDAYPHLKGKAEHPGVMCYSQPEVGEIIGEWMSQLAALPHVTSIDCWMTENLNENPGCGCELCKDSKWPVLEAKAIVAGWKLAQQKLKRPFTLRVMTAEATEFCNLDVIAALPPEVELAYYHSLLTYNSLRRPMLRDYLRKEAARRWMGVVPNLSPTVNFAVPQTGAQFIHYRMNEFVDKGLQGLLGYSNPRVHYYRFNTEAAAEWTWNARGRSPREFALSYAVRQGWKDPEKFAEWSETVGPVSWDVYGSGFPNEELRTVTGPVASRLLQGDLPELGYVLWDAYPAPWGNILNEEQLYGDVKAAAKGVKLANELGEPGILYESLVVDGLIRAQRALYELKRIVRPEENIALDRKQAQRWHREYETALKQAHSNLRKWEDTVITSFEPDYFTNRARTTIDTMIEQMREVARKRHFE